MLSQLCVVSKLTIVCVYIHNVLRCTCLESTMLCCGCLQFTHENIKAQKYMMGGLEQLVGNVHRDILVPKVPHILKTCYDSDIIEEGVILEWDSKVGV